MPEVTIEYEKPETLKILKGLAEYLDFKIISSSPKEKSLDDILVASDTKLSRATSVNGVTIIPGDPTADLSELSKVFTGKNLDAKKLRKEAWQRKK